MMTMMTTTTTTTTTTLYLANSKHLHRIGNNLIRIGIEVLNTGTTVMYYPIIGQQNVYTVYGEKSENISS